MPSEESAGFADAPGIPAPGINRIVTRGAGTYRIFVNQTDFQGFLSRISSVSGMKVNMLRDTKIA